MKILIYSCIISKNKIVIDILKDVLEHHDQLLKFLKETYDSPFGAQLGLSHMLSMYFGNSADFFSPTVENVKEKFTIYMETLLASIWLVGKDEILESVREGTYMEKWHDKVIANINKVAEDGLQQTQHQPDPLGAWLTKMRKTNG